MINHEKHLVRMCVSDGRQSARFLDEGRGAEHEIDKKDEVGRFYLFDFAKVRPRSMAVCSLWIDNNIDGEARNQGKVSARLFRNDVTVCIRVSHYKDIRGHAATVA